MRGGTQSGDYSINISGGNVKVHAGRDALDSNGTINISGGTILAISDAHNGGDSAIDADGETIVTGGTIIYDGSSESGRFGTGSTQSYLYSPTAIKAGDKIIVSKNNAEIVNLTATADMSALGISTPDIAEGDSLTVTINGAVSTVTAGVSGGNSGMGGGMSGGRGGGQWTQEIPEGGTPPQGGMPQGGAPQGGTPPEGGGQRPGRERQARGAMPAE
jgi:hypothetical protein